MKKRNPIGPVIKLPRRFQKIPADLIKHTIAEAEKAIGHEKSHRALRALTIKVLDKLLRNARK